MLPTLAKYPELIEKGKFVVGSIAVVAVLGAAGCSDTSDQAGGNASSQKQGTPKSKVEKLSPEERYCKEAHPDQKTSECVSALKDKTNTEKTVGQPEGQWRSERQPQQQDSQADPQRAEDDVRTAAEAYYQAVSGEDWSYTYDHLDSETKNLYTEVEWFAKNQWFAANGSVTFDILSVDLDNADPTPIANVAVGLNYDDGSSSTRLTYFVYEDGSWKHRFGEEENNLYMPSASYDEFVAAQGGTSSPSPPASSSASPAADATGLKHVKVVVSSNVPVDVSITDDNLDWLQQEEISGTKTYERDIAAGSGLTVSATNSDFRGNVSIQVYENGTLKTQDSDSTGFAQVVY